MEKKEPAYNAIFRIIKNGPIEASGDYHLHGPDGKMIQTNPVTFLCRCGNSGNKPFCDGSHRKSGLRD